MFVKTLSWMKEVNNQGERYVLSITVSFMAKEHHYHSKSLLVKYSGNIGGSISLTHFQQTVQSTRSWNMTEHGMPI